MPLGLASREASQTHQIGFLQGQQFGDLIISGSVWKNNRKTGAEDVNYDTTTLRHYDGLDDSKTREGTEELLFLFPSSFEPSFQPGARFSFLELI